MLKERLADPKTYREVIERMSRYLIMLPESRERIKDPLKHIFTDREAKELRFRSLERPQNRAPGRRYARSYLPKWLADEARPQPEDAGGPEGLWGRHRVIIAPGAMNAINRLCRLIRRGSFRFSRLRAVAVVKRAEEHFGEMPRKPRLPLSAYRRLSSQERNEYRLMVRPAFPDTLLLGALAHLLAEQLFPDRFFLPECCGYIPRRGAREAVRQVITRLSKGYRFVLRLDVQSFNETVPQKRLLNIIGRRAKGKGWENEDISFLMMILSRFLATVDEVLETPGVGIGMGTSMTPLFTNIYLHQLDRHIKRMSIPFTRFGDDLALFFRDRPSAQVASERIATFVSTKLEQTMSGTKVRIIELLPVPTERNGQSAGHGFDFCAYHFEIDEEGLPTIRIKEGTVGKIRRKIKLLTRMPTETSAENLTGKDPTGVPGGECAETRIMPLIRKINALLGFSSTSFLFRGWPASFLNEAASDEIRQQFKSLDRYILYRLKRFEKALGGKGSDKGEFGRRMRVLGLRTFMDAWNRHPRPYRYR